MKLEHALMVPGFGGEYTNTYQRIGDWFRDVNIVPEFVPITWRRTIIDQNVGQFEQVYANHDPSTTVVFGYSLGATVAFAAAARRSPAVLILASMAPWFAEDVPQRSAYHKQLVGRRRLAAYKNFVFSDYANDVTSKTYLLVGGAEARRWPPFKQRAEAVHQTVPGSELFLIPHSEHSPNEAYFEVIHKIIQRLLT